MSELRVETLTMPAAGLGLENPFPALGGPVDVHATLEVSPDIPAEDQKYVGFGQTPGCPQRWLHLMEGLPASVRRNGRMVAIEGRAALAAGQLDRVDQILQHPPTVSDMLEGEVSLTELWFGLHEQRISAAEGKPVDDALKARVRRDFPPPRAIDFRMVT